MPRLGQPDVEREIYEKLEDFDGEEITYPATLKTLFAVRSTVYRFNKEKGRKFRCLIDDDAVRISEKPKKPPHELALKEIQEILKAEPPINELLEQVENIIRSYFGDEEEEKPPVKMAGRVVRGRR